MRENDGRKLSHETLETLRILAVQAVEAGESPRRVIASLGFSRGRIYEWLTAYREGGVDALRAKPVPGRPHKLDPKAMQWIYDTVTSKNPTQMKFEFSLWSHDMVRKLIDERFDVQLSKVSVGRLLEKMGLSPLRPLTRANKRNPEMVDAWLHEEFSLIRQKAKRLGAHIFFVDETNVRSDYQSGTKRVPVIQRTGAQHMLNIISAVNLRGELRFMCHEGMFNAKLFIEFMECLLAKRTAPVFLIVDGDLVHRSGLVRQFVNRHSDRLQLFSLSS